MKIAILVLTAAASLAGQPKQLFNGADLSNWKMVGPGRFTIEDGMMKTEGGMGLLYYTGHPIGDSVVRIVFKTATPRANSGVVIRLPKPPPDPWYGVHNGYEVQIDSGGDEWHCTGAIYSLSKVTKRNQKGQGEWNTMDIELDGQTTRISLNGELVNEFKGDQSVPERKQWYEPVRGPRPDYGYIGLQNHDKNSTIYFKEVSVLPRAGAAPLSQGDRDRMLSYLHSTRKQVEDAASGLSDEQLKYKPAPDRWSVAEIVEHLGATEPFLFAYATSGLAKSAPDPGAEKLKDELVISRMQDRSQRAEAPPALRPSSKLSGADLIKTFNERRGETLEWVRNTQADLRHRFIKWGGGGTLDVYQGLLLIPGHTERHLAQLLEVKNSPGFPQK